MRPGHPRHVRPDDGLQLDAEPQRRPDAASPACSAFRPTRSRCSSSRSAAASAANSTAPGWSARQAAVAARKLNRPVRLLYDRATDMLMVGKRHPYQGDYHIAFTPDGMITGLRLDLKSDAGDTYDCSFAVMDLSLLQSDGCYQVDTLQANGTVYRTNKPSNTAFRTFGTVQPYAVFEDAIEHVAHRLSQTLGRRVLPEEIRRKNLYRDGAPGCHEDLRPDALRTGPDLLQHPRDLGQPVPVVGLRGARRGGRAVQPRQPLAQAGHRHDPTEVRHRVHRAARLAQRLQRPGQRQHGETARSWSSTAAWRWVRD